MILAAAGLVFTSYSHDDYLYLAGEMASLEGSPEAVFYFKQIKNPTFSLRLAQEYTKQQRFKEAHDICLKLLSSKNLPSTQLKARLLLAEIYTSRHRLHKAIARYDEILTNHPHHESALLARSLLSLQLSPKTFKIPPLLRANPSFYQQSGDVYWMQGLKKPAINFYKKALSLTSHRASALRLFQIYSKEGQYQAFTKFMEKKNFEDAYITSLKARAYLKQGLIQKAKTLMEDLLWDHPLNKDLMADVKALPLLSFK